MTNQTTIPLFSAISVNEDFDLIGAVTRVIDSHWYVLGQEVAKFEQEFADHTGVAHCVTVANGTDALTLALRAVGIESGDLVAVVANAGFYGSTAVRTIGAIPLYVEVDDITLTMSTSALKTALLQKPRAVIATHLYGQMAAIEEIAEMCLANNVMLIEDCAQSHGAMRNARRAGSFGDIAAFSFYPTKNLGALGDGGAITTDSDVLAGKVRTLRQYGWSDKYAVTTPHGGNSRLDEMQAAILREKLPRLDSHNEQRRLIAKRYNSAFASLPLKCPASMGDDYVAHLYVVRSERRNELRSFLLVNGVSTDIHYPIGDHMQSAYAQTPLTQALTITEDACVRALSLPCYPGMTDVDVQRVIDAVLSFHSKTEALVC